jgi:putative peptidoglycan lipid II flippase
LDAVNRELTRVLRLALAVVVPLAVCAAVLGPTGGHAIAHGGVRVNAAVIGLTVAAFAPAMIAFSVHYVMLRGFYAMENTRTPFFIQLAVATTNVTAALGFTRLADPHHVPVALALAFGLSYAVGATLSAALLPGSASIFDASMRRFLLRLAIACAITAAAMGGALAAVHGAGVDTTTPGRAFGMLALVGPFGAGAYLVASRLLGLTEFTAVLAAVRRRS